MTTLIGCRYILGLTDRVEATLEEDASVDEEPPLLDTGTVIPECRGTHCIPTSCLDASAPGTGKQCGPPEDGGDAGNCCAVQEIDGGDFLPNNCEAGVDPGCDGGLTHVSAFRLDRFEVTVGRFRQFVNQGYGTKTKPPATGSGVHPRIQFSGWQEAWTQQLAPTSQDLSSSLEACGIANYGTWSVSALVPITCVTWFEAMAFCIWDGGRLPTEAEWSFAATGGAEQREYPWGSADPEGEDAGDAGPYAAFCPNGQNVTGPPDAAPSIAAKYTCSSITTIMPVGFFSPRGDGAFGNAEMAGNAFEYVYDWYTQPPRFPCTDCAVVGQELSSNNARVVRGGSFRYSKGHLSNRSRERMSPGNRDHQFVDTIGFRCARDYPSSL